MRGGATLVTRLLLVSAMSVCGFAARASAAESKSDGFIDIKGVTEDGAWSGGVLQTVFSMLDVHVAQLTYENPGLHNLEFRWKLYVDHDEETVADSFAITGPMDLEDPVLSLVAVIQDAEDTFRVKLRSPDGSTGGTDSNEHLPTGKGRFAQRMRNEIPVGVETPIYCYARTDTLEMNSVSGRSDSHVIATYEWVIILYVKITPSEDEE
jgi:hypothetical protein